VTFRKTNIQKKYSNSSRNRFSLKSSENNEDTKDIYQIVDITLLPAVTGLFVAFGMANDAFAKDGELGILEGKSFAMIHPIAMITLFLVAIYTGLLGLGWKTLREIGFELK